MFDLQLSALWSLDLLQFSFHWRVFPGSVAPCCTGGLVLWLYKALWIWLNTVKPATWLAHWLRSLQCCWPLIIFWNRCPPWRSCLLSLQVAELCTLVHLSLRVRYAYGATRASPSLWRDEWRRVSLLATREGRSGAVRGRLELHLHSQLATNSHSKETCGGGELLGGNTVRSRLKASGTLRRRGSIWPEQCKWLLFFKVSESFRWIKNTMDFNYWRTKHVLSLYAPKEVYCDVTLMVDTILDPNRVIHGTLTGVTAVKHRESN